MNVLEKFRQVTNYDLYTYFTDVSEFMSVNMPVLTAYYKGESKLNKQVFTELNRLYVEAIKIEQITSLLRNSLSNTTEFWDLVDNLSITKTKLETCLNLGKWMRSSYVYGYENQSKFIQILRQGQTMEALSTELGSVTPNDDWVNIAVSNSLMELDYDYEGGNELSLNNKDNRQLNVTTVVDIMVGDNILGKDLPQKIEITEDDITSLTTKQTMGQSADICLQVTKGSVPEFQTLGIPKQYVGSNLTALRMSSLIREVKNNFDTDDAFKSIELVNSGVDQDVAFYEFRIESRLHDEINKTL